jgi:hypothetical protein
VLLKICGVKPSANSALPIGPCRLSRSRSE